MDVQSLLKWAGPGVLMLMVLGFFLAIIGSFNGDPTLSTGGLDILKILTGGIVGIFAGRKSAETGDDTE